MLRPGSAIKRKIKPPPQVAAQRQAVSDESVTLNPRALLGRIESTRGELLLEEARFPSSPDPAGLWSQVFPQTRRENIHGYRLCSFPQRRLQVILTCLVYSSLLGVLWTSTTNWWSVTTTTSSYICSRQPVFMRSLSIRSQSKNVKSATSICL